MPSFQQWRQEFANPTQLLETVARLVSDGELSAEQAERLVQALPGVIRDSRYVLSHLGSHMAVGVLFGFDIVPLPLGTIARVIWVGCSRVYETCRGSAERAAVHSLAVLGVSAIPFVGYFAYLIPLRAQNADAAALYANHIAYRWYNRSLEQCLRPKPRWIQRLVRGIVGTTEPNPSAVQPHPTAGPTPIPREPQFPAQP